MLIKVFQPAFFAREDTTTPMRFATYNLVINAALSLVLFVSFQSVGWWGHVGIALATSAAAWINAIGLWLVLARRGDFIVDAKLVRRLSTVVVASAAMAMGLYLSRSIADPMMAFGEPLWQRVGVLAALIGACCAGYFAIAIATGAIPRAAFKRRRSPNAGVSSPE